MIGAPQLHGSGRVVYPQPPGMVELLARTRGFSADAQSGNIHFERY